MDDLFLLGTLAVYTLVALMHTGRGALALLLVGAVLSIAPTYAGAAAAVIALIAGAVAVSRALEARNRD